MYSAELRLLISKTLSTYNPYYYIILKILNITFLNITYAKTNIGIKF
ncbi:Hypothetical protein ADU72_2121 [Pediococcus damnosus]|uniref:Uncharacterized protein n=1 Tax=Pediococcus damnosus TaxID=51663 RepID=A0ABN4NGW3_9LACO|nr:Hypothetical protein ADU72_2121 [Pediococcus damnosus]